MSYLHRAATTNYLCYVPVLEDSKGAGRARLTRFARAKVYKFINLKGTRSNVFYLLTKSPTLSILHLFLSVVILLKIYPLLFW